MKVSKTTKAIPFPELRGSIHGIKFPAIAQVKIDGEFCFIHFSKEQSFCVNKYGKIRFDFPALNAMKERVLAHHQSATYLGELYYGHGKNGDLYELLKNKESDDLKLYRHDIIEVNGADLRNKSLLDRFEILYTSKAIGTGIRRSLRFVNNTDDVKEFFKKSIKMGYEGIVVKNLEGKLILGICDWVKVKSKDRNDYQLVFIDATQERIEVLVPIANAGPGVSVKLGVKAPSKYKKHLILGQMVTIEHQGVLPSGALRHPVLIPDPKWKGGKP